jgi:hypothetical protein
MFARVLPAATEATARAANGYGWSVTGYRDRRPMAICVWGRTAIITEIEFVSDLIFGSD